MPTWFELDPGTLQNPKSPTFSCEWSLVVEYFENPAVEPGTFIPLFAITHCTKPEQSRPFLVLPL